METKIKVGDDVIVKDWVEELFGEVVKKKGTKIWVKIGSQTFTLNEHEVTKL